MLARWKVIALVALAAASRRPRVAIRRIARLSAPALARKPIIVLTCCRERRNRRTRCGNYAGCLLPLDLQPDLSLPCIGVAVEADVVVDVAVEGRGVRDLPGRADAQRCPIVAEFGGEGDEAGGRRELRRRVAEELVPEIRPSPQRELALRIAVDIPVACYPGADPAGQRIGVRVADIGRAVVEVVDVEVLVDELRLRLEQPVIAEVERIAALKRGSETEAAGLAVAQAAPCPSCPCRTRFPARRRQDTSCSRRSGSSSRRR